MTEGPKIMPASPCSALRTKMKGSPAVVSSKPKSLMRPVRLARDGVPWTDSGTDDGLYTRPTLLSGTEVLHRPRDLGFDERLIDIATLHCYM
jgi:hypothetical protein